jgi:hypothetical protein
MMIAVGKALHSVYREAKEAYVHTMDSELNRRV